MKLFRGMTVPVWLTPRGGGKFTKSKELFGITHVFSWIILWNGMSLIILGKILFLCWSVSKPGNLELNWISHAWLEQLVSRWNAQKGGVCRMGMERGLISLNDWNRWFNN